MTSVSAAADRRCHLAVDIWGFLLRRCTKTGTLGAEAEVFEGAKAPLIHVRRISDIRRILQLTHSGRYRLPCRRMLCNQHYCTVYCPRRSYSACFFSYGICQCFWFWGPRRGKIGCSLPRRSGQIQRAVCHGICRSYSAADLEGWVKLSINLYFRTRSTQPFFPARAESLGVPIFFLPSFSPSRFFNGYYLLIWLGHQLSVPSLLLSG